MSAVAVACVRQDVVFGADRRYLVIMSEWKDAANDRRDTSERVLVVRIARADSRRVKRERLRKSLRSLNKKKALLLIKKRRLVKAHESYGPKRDYLRYDESPRTPTLPADNMQAVVIALHMYGPLIERLSKG